MKNNIETVRVFLDGLGIKYEMMTHPAAATIEECEKIEKLIGGEICKNLLLTTSNGKELFLLMTGGRKRFVTKEVSKKLGSSRLSFAGGEVMESVLNTSPGSLSILSLLFDKEKKVRLAADKDVFAEEFICCHPCDNTATLKLKTEDVTNTVIPALGAELILTEL